MPYLLVSTQIRLENGPTFVGDEKSDPKIMDYLDAVKIKPLGNKYHEWRTEDPPRIILDKLEKIGYKVISMTGIGQTCAWVLHKEIDD